MPIYVFENPDTGEVKEVIQKMSEDHSYSDENGLEWRRVWFPSNFNVDGKPNPWSSSSMGLAENKNYTLGEMWERSAEMSERRKEKEGKDSVKEKWLQDYSKKRKGAKYSKGGGLISGGDGLSVELSD